MMAPLILLLLSVLACVAALVLPGWTDLVLLAGPCALASLWLLIRAVRLSPKAKPTRYAVPDVGPIRWLVIDGSNVMHWKDGAPAIETVQAVVRHVTAQGFTPGVMFDANAGYLIAGKYQHDHAFGRMLGLPENRVMVVPKGEPADPAILRAARDLGAQVVSNDRFRDWGEQFPEVRTPGHVIRGGYRDGQLWLDLTNSPAQNTADSERALT